MRLTKEQEDYLIRYNAQMRESGGCGGPTVFVVMLLVILLCGCSPKVIETIVTHTDTVYQVKIQHDSIVRTDSVFLHEYTKGDTVFVEKTKWLREYIDRWRTDTLIEVKNDTIKSVEVKEVPRKLTSWQQFVMWTGRLTLIALILAVGFYAVRAYLHRKML